MSGMSQLRMSAVVLLSVLIIEILAWMSFGAFPPFLNRVSDSGAQFNESAHPLYSVLDPSLGYTFRTDYSVSADDKKNLMFEGISKSAENLGNGFVRYRHAGPGEPIVIVTLGNCSTDAHLFHGNWPWQLHELLISRGIPHEIYNGAVSGYNSFQELTKLTRDVFKLRDRIDFVVSYNGFTDVPGQEDVVRGFAGVHPYQQALLMQASGRSSVDRQPVVLPNTQRLVGSLKVAVSRRQQMEIQLGVQSESAVGDYVRNVRFMSAVVASQGAEMIHFIQPLAASGRQMDRSTSYSMEEDPGLESETREFFGRISEELRGHPHTYRIDGDLAEQQDVFYSFSQLAPKGQKLLAARVVEIMRKSPKWRFVRD
jgi:hypothetical protein